MANYSLRNHKNPSFNYTTSNFKRITNANSAFFLEEELAGFGSMSSANNIGLYPHIGGSWGLMMSGRVFENGKEVYMVDGQFHTGFVERVTVINGSKDISNLATPSNNIAIVIAQGGGGGGGGGAGWNNFMNPADAGGQGGHSGASTVTTICSNNLRFSGFHIYGGSGGSGGGHLTNGSDGRDSYYGSYDDYEGIDVKVVCAQGGSGGGRGQQNQNNCVNNYSNRTTTFESNRWDTSFYYKENTYSVSTKGGNVQQEGSRWSNSSLTFNTDSIYYQLGTYSAEFFTSLMTPGTRYGTGGKSYGDNNVGRAGGGGGSMGGVGGDANKNGPTNGGYGAGGGGGTSRNGGGQTGGKGGDGYVTLVW